MLAGSGYIKIALDDKYLENKMEKLSTQVGWYERDTKAHAR